MEHETKTQLCVAAHKISQRLPKGASVREFIERHFGKIKSVDSADTELLKNALSMACELYPEIIEDFDTAEPDLSDIVSSLVPGWPPYQFGEPTEEQMASAELELAAAEELPLSEQFASNVVGRIKESPAIKAMSNGMMPNPDPLKRVKEEVAKCMDEIKELRDYSQLQLHRLSRVYGSLELLSDLIAKPENKPVRQL